MCLLIISIFCITLCMFVYYLLYFCSNVNCIVYPLMYVHIFSYLVNKLDIWWVYLSPIEEIKHKKNNIININKHKIFMKE